MEASSKTFLWLLLGVFDAPGWLQQPILLWVSEKGMAPSGLACPCGTRGGKDLLGTGEERNGRGGWGNQPI